MQLLTDRTSFDYEPLVATIGFFDGVHIGHRHLIDQVKKIAKVKGLSSAVITFPIHPRKVMEQGYQPALLCDYNEKLVRLGSTETDFCIPLNFTYEISQMSAQQFMHEILKNKYKIDTLVIGYDHRFGHNRVDGFEEYHKYGKEIGVDVVLAQQLASPYVSSSHIRSLLKDGNIEEVAKLLSYHYLISGKIIKGFQIGRTIGFPTANIELWEQHKVVPAYGVYAVHIYIEGEQHEGMLYIGKRPTLHNDDNISIEVNIFDYDGNLYGKSLSAEFLEYVRHDKKFPDIESLKQQLQQDKLNVAEILENYR